MYWSSSAGWDGSYGGSGYAAALPYRYDLFTPGPEMRVGFGQGVPIISDVIPISSSATQTRNYGGDGSGSFLDVSTKIADELNQYNPLANLWDVTSYAFNGTDRLGNNMGLGEASLKASSVFVIGKIGTLALTTRGAAKGAEKAIVIGEGIYRVRPAARSVGAKW